MIIKDDILNIEEKTALALRSLYAENGYTQFRMSKFEEYELYLKNKDFLASGGIITFTDTNGKLLALKPDVTLSIVKNSKDVAGSVQKVFYAENVYRISGGLHTYREIMQTGLECIGDVGKNEIAEVVKLAMKSGALIGKGCRMAISHMKLVNSYLADLGINPSDEKIIAAINEKNTDAIKKLCAEWQYKALVALVKTYKNVKEAEAALSKFTVSEETKAHLSELSELWSLIFGDSEASAALDLSLANSTGYYSGIIFKGYVQGIATPVISGGQYDGLMERLGRRSHAIGFAVYLDDIGRLDDMSDSQDDYINVALPKGRLGEKVYGMFERAGFDCPAIKEENRKLIFENSEKKLRFFWVKPSDVAIYVERGAADIGVAGYDILAEYGPDVYDLCDLEVGKCRMSVAAKKDFKDDGDKTLRVATKFANIAQSFYADKCREIDIIHLNGSIELAPILGLSDVIVDIVETGKTLYENDLLPYEDIMQISAHLIANKSAFQFKKDTIEKIREAIADQRG